MCSTRSSILFQKNIQKTHIRDSKKKFFRIIKLKLPDVDHLPHTDVYFWGFCQCHGVAYKSTWKMNLTSHSFLSSDSDRTTKLISAPLNSIPKRVISKGLKKNKYLFWTGTLGTSEKSWPTERDKEVLLSINYFYWLYGKVTYSIKS